MTEEDILTRLYTIDALRSPNLIFGSRKGKSEESPFFVRRAAAAEELTETLAERVLGHLRNLAKEAKVSELRAYDASYMADQDEPRYVKLADDEIIAGVHNSITPNTANIEVFRINERGNMRLSYYCLHGYDADGNEVRFYNGMFPGRQLKPTNKVQAFIRGKKFIAATETPLIFDPQFTCVTYLDHVFIFGTQGFEALFHYYEELKAFAEKTLDDINARHVAIEDFDILKASVLENKSNVKRLRGILKKGHLEKYTVESIEATIRECKMDITVSRGSDGRPTIHWEEGQERQVLRLLEEYHVVGMTSGLVYGSNSKELLRTPR